jgi:signal transduction histidine kinase
MRERVSALGGSIMLASERGAGFQVKASLPVAGAPS